VCKRERDKERLNMCVRERKDGRSLFEVLLHDDDTNLMVMLLCSGVASFPGAEIGTGGRLRDVQVCSRGGRACSLYRLRSARVHHTKPRHTR
jgi:hypothetical protein